MVWNSSLLNHFKEQLKYQKHFLKSKKKNVLVWQDLDSCFKTHVRTEATINFFIKNPLQFFKKAPGVLILKHKKILQISLLNSQLMISGSWTNFQNGITCGIFMKFKLLLSSEITRFIHSTKAVLENQYYDEYCFLWAIVATFNLKTTSVSRFFHTLTVVKINNDDFLVDVVKTGYFMN